MKEIIVGVLVFILIICIIVGCCITLTKYSTKQNNKIYTVIAYLPDGSVNKVTNVRLKEGISTYEITKEDGTIYLISKEQCVIIIKNE